MIFTVLLLLKILESIGLVLIKILNLTALVLFKIYKNRQGRIKYFVMTNTISVIKKNTIGQY